MCLSNFKAIRQFKIPISWLRDFSRSYGKTSFRILRRGPGCIRTWHALNLRVKKDNDFMWDATLHKPIQLKLTQNVRHSWWMLSDRCGGCQLHEYSASSRLVLGVPGFISYVTITLCTLSLLNIWKTYRSLQYDESADFISMHLNNICYKNR